MDKIRHTNLKDLDRPTAKIVLAAHSYLRDDELKQHGYDPQEIRNLSASAHDTEYFEGLEVKGEPVKFIIIGRGIPEFSGGGIEFCDDSELHKITTFSVINHELYKWVFTGRTANYYDFHNEFVAGEFVEVTFVSRQPVSMYEAYQKGGPGLFLKLADVMDWTQILRQF